jgi:adhesin/invasin|tara:strand:- start:905 stop:1759 length:855 start_codon:yes stop_codon:yes gene_type:complete
MKKYIILLISTLIFASSTSIADTSKIKNDFFSSIESFLDGNFEDTDFSIKSTEGLKPQIGILTFKPLNETDEGLTFFQGSFFTHDGDRETLNLGLGKRMFNEDDSAMFGLNVFYDHELDYNHQRISIGGEIKSSILELSTNHYFGTSGEQTGKNNIKEEVADGYDLEFGAHVPYIPTAKMYAKIFEYDIPGGSDYEGVEYSSNIGIPNSGVNFEVGYKEYGNNAYEDQWFFNLTFSLSKMNPNTSFVSDKAFERVSMKDKKYEKVRRENLIVKSKAFSVKAGGF